MNFGTMRKSLLSWLAGAAVAAGVLVGSTGDAQAQEIQLTGPLAGAPPARHLRLYRQGRFEIAPTVSFTLLDEYRRPKLAFEAARRAFSAARSGG